MIITIRSNSIRSSARSRLLHDVPGIAVLRTAEVQHIAGQDTYVVHLLHLGAQVYGEALLQQRVVGRVLLLAVDELVQGGTQRRHRHHR